MNKNEIYETQQARFTLNSPGTVSLDVNGRKQTVGNRCGKIADLSYPILIDGPANLGRLPVFLDFVEIKYC